MQLAPTFINGRWLKKKIYRKGHIAPFLFLKLSMFCKGDNPSFYRENLRTSTSLKSVDLKINFGVHTVDHM